MIAMRFEADALAHVRFAISPLAETLQSIRVLDDPAGQALHLPWVAQARARTADLDLALLRALQPRGAYSPDFVGPPPRSPLAEFEDEIAEILRTPPATVRAELRHTYSRRPLPAAVEPLLADPEEGVQTVAELLRTYWARAVQDHWARIRGVLEADVLHRARELADGGAQRLFTDLDPTVSWADGVLRIEKRVDATLDLDERGLLFVPSAFVWPRVLVITDPAWQPTLIYPARGVGMLWAPPEAPAPDALAALLGHRRGAVLAALDRPRSTTDLARALGVSAASVSQHLTVLRGAGLVNGTRVGRVVLYVRSEPGDALVAAAS